MTDGFSSQDLKRKFLSALSALLLAFLIFALLPLSQMGIFTRKIEQTRYTQISLAAPQKKEDTGSQSSFSNNLALEFSPSQAGHASNTGALPDFAIPEGYGIADSPANGVGDVFAFNSFSVGATSIKGEDFAVQSFEFAQLDSIPRRLKNGKSEYPRHLYKRGIEGDVLLSLFINEDGSVEVDRVLSSTHKDFEKAAQDAAKSQTYEPPTRGGKAVRARFELLVPFKIVK